MLRPRLSTYLTMLTILLFSSCHPLGCSWDFGYSQLTAAPNDSKLLGTYKLDEKSSAYLKSNGLNPENCTLTLNKDKSFTLKNAPSGISDYNSPTIAFSKAGTWSVNCGESYGCLIDLQGLCVVPLSEKDDRFAVPITIGDGDECNGIVFVKD
jgi:hypothetical protein